MRIGRASALTDRGRRRLRNEDAFVREPPLFAVADGMGGAQAGELASRLAAAALEETSGGARGTEAVAALVRKANERVYRRAIEDPAAAGMGTTITAALVDEAAGTLAIAHVGDSRAYRIRDDALEQLTRDHSLVQELVDSGRLTQEEADAHPQRSVITRALGTEPDIEIDTLNVEGASGDLYLLCSDGLTTMIRDTDIVELVEAAGRDPAQVAPALIEAANQAGGEDNVTVVVFELVDSEPEELNNPAAPAGSPTNLDETSAEALARDSELHAPEPAGAANASDLEPQGLGASAEAPVRRHGAGPGGRWLALAVIVVGFAVAALMLWWGLT